MEKKSKEEVDDLSIKEYGSDVYLYAQQREGYVKGYQDAEIEHLVEWKELESEKPEFYKLVLVFGYAPLYINKTLAVCWYAKDKSFTIAGTDSLMKDVLYWSELTSIPEK